VYRKTNAQGGRDVYRALSQGERGKTGEKKKRGVSKKTAQGECGKKKEENRGESSQRILKCFLSTKKPGKRKPVTRNRKQAYSVICQWESNCSIVEARYWTWVVLNWNNRNRILRNGGHYTRVRREGRDLKSVETGTMM